MSTINEEAHVGTDTADVAPGHVAVLPAAGDAVSAVKGSVAEGDTRQTTDGADDGEVERELDEMENSATCCSAKG